MNEGPPIDAELLPPESSAVVKRDPLMPPPEQPRVTAAQARIEAVADLTKTALAQAGTLKLTAEETAALTADFADEDFYPGAGGKEQLLYIQHSALRDRLNKVLGLGQWAIIVRETWNEDFKIPARQGVPEKNGVRVYSRAMLLVRGAYVGEAVGDMDYFPHNASQNYGDAFEGSKTAAFRRCAKEFGIGLQAWRKDWGDGWWARKRAQGASGASKPVQTPSTAQKPPESKPAPAKATPAKPVDKSEEWKQYALVQFRKADAVIYAYGIAMLDGWCLPGVERLDEVDAKKFPQSLPDFKAFEERMAKLRSMPVTQDLSEAYERAYATPGQSGPPSEPAPIQVPRDTNLDPNSPDAPWRSFPVPFGKNAGTQLAKLDKNVLYGFWANYQPEETWVNKTGQTVRTKPEKLEKDRLFRSMLDEAGKHYEFEKPEDAPKNEDDIPF